MEIWRWPWVRNCIRKASQPDFVAKSVVWNHGFLTQRPICHKKLGCVAQIFHSKSAGQSSCVSPCGTIALSASAVAKFALQHWLRWHPTYIEGYWACIIIYIYYTSTHKLSLHMWSSDCWWYSYFIASAYCCCLDIPATPQEGCPFVVSYCSFELTNIDWLRKQSPERFKHKFLVNVW